MSTIRAAIAQLTPGLCDREQSLKRVFKALSTAHEENVQLLVFPESFVSGYPYWCDLPDFATFGDDTMAALHERMLQSAMEIPSAELESVCAAARAANCGVALGLSERVGRTLYNSFILIDRAGELVIHHRKLVPTHGERLIWKSGDAHGMTPATIAGARVAGLICWEHWMPMPRQILHDQEEQIHCALWPSVREMYLVASRHYAFEGRCFVLAAASVLKATDLPADWPLKATGAADSDGYILSGGSSIIGPDGRLIRQAKPGQKGLLIADLETKETLTRAFDLDVSGHSARADLMTLKVDRRRLATKPSIEES